MVSHSAWIGRPFAVMLLIFTLTTIWLAPAPAWARNPYTIRDDFEGDPGDGVLNPEVVPEPAPTPKGGNNLVFLVTFVDMGEGHLIPVFHLQTQFVGNFGPSWSRAVTPLTFEGRWHRAP